MTPATEPLTTWRNARFVEEWHFTSEDEPISLFGYTGALQVRLYGAQPGAAKIDLANVTSEAEGVWIIEPAQGVIRVRIDQITLQNAFDDLFGGNEAGTSLQLVYDLRLIRDSAAEVWVEGPFTINPGVTISG